MISATPLSTPSLTSTWSSRTHERALLSSLLHPSRFLSHLCVYGLPQQGKTSVVLDILTQNECHFAYIDCTRPDRLLVKRIIAQLVDRTIGPKIFRKLCCDDGDGRTKVTQTAAASSTATFAASSATDDADASLIGSATKGGRGRKRKSAVASTTNGVVTTDDPMDTSDTATAAISSDRLVADLTDRASGKDGQISIITSAANGSSMEDVTVPAGASSSDTSGASALGLGTVSSTRSQITELSRVISALRHKRAIVANLPLQTFHIVLDRIDHYADSAYLLTSLASLDGHTQYPVSLVLISNSLPSPSPDRSYFGMSYDLANEHFMIIPWRKYESEEIAEIVARRMWTTNARIQEAFLPPTTSSAPISSSSPLPFILFSTFLSHFITILYSRLSTSLTEIEAQVRGILPEYLKLIRKYVKSGEIVLTEESKNSKKKIDVTQISGKLLVELNSTLQQHMNRLWTMHTSEELNQEDEEADRAAIVAAAQVDDGGKTSRKKVKRESAAAAVPSSSSINLLASSIKRASSITASSSSLSPHSHLLQLNRTRKYLLLSSFLASYNPPSHDTTLFTTYKHKKSNRKGKSSNIEVNRQRFDAKKQAANEQLSQLQIGPNAASIERVLAYYQAIAEEEKDGGSVSSSSSFTSSSYSSSSSCYIQLKSLISAQYIEQLSSSSSSSAASSTASKDLLSSVKIRCLLTKEQMEEVCKSIGDEVTQQRKGGNTAGAGGEARLGEGISLAAYLYDGARRK